VSLSFDASGSHGGLRERPHWLNLFDAEEMRDALGW